MMSTAPPSRGKLKDFNSDYDDLDPVITYKHILSSTIGPKHPLRVVALCDCNAFYANCEQVRLKLDPEVPLVVLQWGMLIAVNYPAREYGVSRMDKLDEALKRCKDLKVVHVATYEEGDIDGKPIYRDNPDAKKHKISLDIYRRESNKVVSVYKEGLPTGEIEKASIDESFIDFSIPVRDELIRRFPYLSKVPPEAPQGIDTPIPPPPPTIDWSGTGNLVPIDPTKFDPTDKTLTTEQVVESENTVVPTWHDVCLAIAAQFMAKLRKDVYDKLGYYTSAGIARNKFLAKLVASYRKRNTQNILRNSAIPGFLKPMPFQKIRFLGGKLGKALAEEFDASTVADLLSISLDDMQNKFGESAIWLYEVLRGIDRSEVKEKPTLAKSMLASKNLPTPLTKPEEAHPWIKLLSSELAIRLREARELTPGLWPKTLSVSVSQGWSRRISKQAPFPSPRPVSIELIVGEATKLWSTILKTGKTKNMKITHMGVSFHDVGWMEEGQRGIQGFLNAPSVSGARAASEGIQDTSTVVSGSSTNLKRRSMSVTPAPVQDAVDVINVDGDETCSFTCERCKKAIFLSNKVLSECNGEGGDDFATELRLNALTALRLEHEDFHFAQDLAQQDRQPITSTTSPMRPAKKRKTEKDESKGIAKFFVQKGKT